MFCRTIVLPCSPRLLGTFVTWSSYHCDYRSFVVRICWRMIKKSTWRWNKMSPMTKSNWTDGEREDEINFLKSRNSPLLTPTAQRGQRSSPDKRVEYLFSCFGRRALTFVLLGKHSQPEVSMWDLTVINMTVVAVAFWLVFPIWYLF